MFKPLTTIEEKFSEGEKVRITIQDKESSANEIMKLAENFYEGLSEEDIDEIEKIALDRSNFFGDRKP